MRLPLGRLSPSSASAALHALVPTYSSRDDARKMEHRERPGGELRNRLLLLRRQATGRGLGPTHGNNASPQRRPFQLHVPPLLSATLVKAVKASRGGERRAALQWKRSTAAAPNERNPRYAGASHASGWQARTTLGVGGQADSAPGSALRHPSSPPPPTTGAARAPFPSL